MTFHTRTPQLKPELTIEFINSLSHITESDWQKLSTTQCPFQQYNFFTSLEESESVSVQQGWQPHHLIAKSANTLTAIMPMYLKSHSWGEYVFDWDWADAFKRNNIAYYPKLVATIPFTPVSSQKLLSTKQQTQTLFSTLTEHCQRENINSWHILYCDKFEKPLTADVYERNTVQFHWLNRGYKSFTDYLGTFTARKHKNTRKERLSITQQGIHIRQLKGHEISPQELQFFYLTYQLTYIRRGHQPHLSFNFF